MSQSHGHQYRIGGYLLVLLSLMLLSTHARAQSAQPQYEWRDVVVGEGGFVPGIVFSRVEPGLACARCDIGGPCRWDARAARWIPLQDAMSEGNDFGIESVASHPKDANIVYAAAGMYRRDPAAILRSRDRGNTWDIFPVSFRCVAMKTVEDWASDSRSTRW